MGRQIQNWERSDQPKIHLPKKRFWLLVLSVTWVAGVDSLAGRYAPSSEFVLREMTPWLVATLAVLICLDESRRVSAELENWNKV